MSVRADHYEEGSIVRARPPHPYDPAWRTIGTVVLSSYARLVWGGDGLADAGTVSVEVDPRWIVRAFEAPRWPACFTDREPDEPDIYDGPTPGPHLYPRECAI